MKTPESRTRILINPLAEPLPRVKNEHDDGCGYVWTPARILKHIAMAVIPNPIPDSLETTTDQNTITPIGQTGTK